MDCWTAYYYGEHISDDDLSTMIKETEEVVKYFGVARKWPRKAPQVLP